MLPGIITCYARRYISTHPGTYCGRPRILACRNEIATATSEVTGDTSEFSAPRKVRDLEGHE